MSYVFSFRMVIFYLVTTGWIFYISLCENSINDTINMYYSHMNKHIKTMFRPKRFDDYPPVMGWMLY